jgi:hypothetical protein
MFVPIAPHLQYIQYMCVNRKFSNISYSVYLLHSKNFGCLQNVFRRIRLAFVMEISCKEGEKLHYLNSPTRSNLCIQKCTRQGKYHRYHID